MRSNGIYVEIPIDTHMDRLWQYTQEPSLHQQWDLRFTSIEYLPKPTPTAPQRFLYTTAIGFGIRVAGEGESVGTRVADSGESTSALKFWSDAPISLIETGSGYWKYRPNGETIQFLTWYDYKARFGVLGALVDRWTFRPLIGWATAWSFDRLRLWLEKGITPAQSLRAFSIHVATHLALAFIWLYQGLVPKLLFPDSGEVEILRASGFFRGNEEMVLVLVGLVEILFGVLFLLPRLRRWLHYLNMLGLVLLGLGGILSQPSLLVQPFNPLTLTVAMIALSIVALINGDDVPYATRCKRRAAA